MFNKYPTFLSNYLINQFLILHNLIKRMTFYRSDSINYYKLVLPRESAWQIMNKLGQNKLIHIVPSSTPVLNRPFHTQVKRCEDAIHRIDNLDTLLKDQAVYLPRSDFPHQAYIEIYEMWAQLYQKSNAHPTNVLNDIIGEVEHAWNYHQDLTKRAQVLSSKMLQFRDNLALIQAGKMKFGRSFFTHRQQRSEQLGRQLLHGATMSFKCGVIRVDQQLRFKKTVFRITKGNSLVQCVPFGQIFPNLLPAEHNKVAFFVLYPGRANSYFDKKLGRLIENFSQGKYELPSNDSDFQPVVKNLQQEFLQAESLLDLTQRQITLYLQKLAEPMAESSYFRRHEYLKLYLFKEKQLYAGLNQMDFFNNFLQGKIYVRTEDIQALQATLTQVQNQLKLPAGQLVNATAQKYPTHYTINDFTRSAQQIVETYGVAKYQQANPSFFTVVTFPFLFGVMFGDMGHGLILFTFGLYLVFWKQKINNPILKMLLPHRYLFTMMGFFAAYCGFIYNDYLSISLNLFGSCYNTQGVVAGSPIPRQIDCVYPFGLDPVWSVSQNYLNYVNSLKMKISVIIAVVHMTLGVLVKATNSLHFGKLMDFVFEFIPQLTFLILLFGYMDFLIIYKWTVDWSYQGARPPSIITTMINLPLRLGKTTDCCGGQPMWGTYGDTSQDHYQKIFLIVSLIAIPLMLLPKPLYQIYCHPSSSDYKKIQEQQDAGKLLGSSENIDGYEKSGSSLAGSRVAKVNEHSADEIFVHQLIETIQYVLGCISNTASYLRLWALSLAHSQLSQVFFQKLVEGGLVKGFGGIPIMLFGFVVLAGATFGVLMCMDSMECFLHTLRLHWVQFQNKFYKGDGFPFVFYSFSDRIAKELQVHA